MNGLFLFRFEKIQTFEMERFSNVMMIYLYTSTIGIISWIVSFEFYPLAYRYINGNIGTKENWQSNLKINYLIKIINVKDITFIISLLSPFLSYFVLIFISLKQMECQERMHGQYLTQRL